MEIPLKEQRTLKYKEPPLPTKKGNHQRDWAALSRTVNLPAHLSFLDQFVLFFLFCFCFGYERQFGEYSLFSFMAPIPT